MGEYLEENMAGRRPPRKVELAWFRRSLMRWFTLNGRELFWRSERACIYTMVVSEVLLQRTQASVVSGFLPTFLASFPDWQAIAQSDNETIGQVLRPLGLWRRRASALLSLSTEITRREGRWPGTRQELEEMPAVGQYVASAVLMFEHGVPAPLMDASMARVLRRYFAIRPEKVDIRYDKQLQEVAHAVVDDPEFVRLNWAILDFAALQCTKSCPSCKTCDLRSRCAYFAERREAG